MTLSWPGTLPPTLIINNAQHAQVKNAIASQPDTGPRMQRRRFTGVYEQWSGHMIMTAAQWAIAQAYYQNTLLGGVLTFQMNHPVTGTAQTAQFMAEDPQALGIASMEGSHVTVALKLQFGPLTV